MRPYVILISKKYYIHLSLLPKDLLRKGLPKPSIWGKAIGCVNFTIKKIINTVNEKLIAIIEGK